MVVVARDLTPPGTGPVRPPCLGRGSPGGVAGDPQFRGNDAAFCQAYGSNRYAPDKR